MSTHRHFDKICCVVIVLTLILTAFFMNAEAFGVHKESNVMGYENKLFDTSTVHTLNIIIDDWDEFIDNAKSEEYYDCTVVIDNEAYKNVAIRGKGNTSLSMVNNDRYSFKIEFDHYDSSNTYYGLDKLCLNNIIQDNTYMKDYLTYQMMAEMGVASPLCSYVYITVNGEDWGLYLAVEGVEDSFLKRNYGSNYGELYKPDSMKMGGGRGNGKQFDMEEFMNDSDFQDTDITEFDNQMQMPNGNIQNIEKPDINMKDGQMPEGFVGEMPSEQMPNTMHGQTPPEITNGELQNNSDLGEIPQGMTPPSDGSVNADNNGVPEGNVQQGGRPNGNMPEFDMQGGQMPGGGMNNGSDDVLLKYIDDEIDSYSNIFDNAKTDVSNSDKTRLIQALKKLSAGEELSDTVEIETVIRYFVVHNFVLNFDSYTGSMIHNYYLYEKDGQIQMIPWDYNLAFGGFQSMGGSTSLVNYPIDTPISGGNTEDRPMIAWIFDNEEYTELYHTIFVEFISEYFDSGYFENMFDSVTEMIAPYVEKDPTKFCTYEEFEKGTSTLREFCLLRAESISGQLNGSIGSTDSTQDSSTLVDAGELQISDMGTMNHSMGGNRNHMDGSVSHMPNDKNNTNEDTQSIPNGKSEINMGQNNGNRKAQKFDGNTSNFNGNQQRTEMNGRFSNTDWTLLAVCVGILAIGLVVTTLFKRRKK